ncbi:MAG: EFR1 family ferrodoxin [Lachnospiraceae bacterium]|nr:EFR1 family ferrodoxin [Lachnospiraceae bacterium]
MRLYEMVFSPTGGTAKVASILSGVWKMDRIKIDLLSNKPESGTIRLKPEDVCIVAVPSFGGRVPGIAAERIKAIKGNGARAVLTAVYGNRAIDDTLTELQDILEAAGFCCVAGIAAVAEHSLMHQFGAGRPDTEDEKELRHFAEQIRNMLEKHVPESIVPEKNMMEKGRSEKDMPEMKDGGKSRLVLPGNHKYREYNGVPFKPTAGKGCNRCGRCAAACPVGAISKDNPRRVEKNKCISCMHCAAVCPQRARRLNPVMLSIASHKMKKACQGRKENLLFLREE